MLIVIIITCSFLVQLAAVISALQLIKITRKAYSWIFISLALFLMMVRRIISLYHLITNDMPYTADMTNEFIGMLLSVLMLLGIIGIKKIFIARVNAEREADLSAIHIHYLSKYANDFIILLDEDFKFLEVNDRVADFYGYEKKELIGMHASQLRAPESKEGFSGQIAQAKLSGKALYEAVHKRKDGSTFPVEISIRTIEKEGNRFYQAVIRDITERKRAQADIEKYQRHLEEMVEERTAELSVARDRAESADRLKSAFLATMSHELRTPLNSIIGFTGIILQELAGPLNAEQAKQLKMVQGSARHLLALINDVLDISKIEAGQLEVHTEEFNIKSSIEKVAGIVGPLVNNKGLEFKVEIAPEIGLFKSDPRRVEQVLLNLVNNAIKFTDKGSVTLAAKIKDSAMRISVTDTGIGIKPEDIDKLFQPFRQIDSGLSRQHEGTGLGLAICRKLAGLLGGEITAESSWGRGSVFTLVLPLSGNDGIAPAAK